MLANDSNRCLSDDYFFLGIKPSTSVLVQTLKTVFLTNFQQIYRFFPFLKLFGMKNEKEAYFDQGLECAAPKRW